MFPLQSNTTHELAFGTPSTSYLTQSAHEDLITINNESSLENNLINFAIGRSNDGESNSGIPRPRKKESRDECSSSSKKAMHRQQEKKRRHQMSNLYASLRSLLPDHQIKGKHSVCDQMGEAAIHIKRMEKNIEGLQIRRDKLKSNVINSSSRENSETLNGDNAVIVNMASNGIEILISHSIKRSDLGLSRVLAELQRTDLDVISSVSTRIREKFVYKIQVEVRDTNNLDLFALKDRLSKAIK